MMLPTWPRVIPSARSVASSRRDRCTLATSAWPTASTPSAATKPSSTNGSAPMLPQPVDGGRRPHVLDVHAELCGQRGPGPLVIDPGGEADEHVALLGLLSRAGGDRRVDDDRLVHLVGPVGDRFPHHPHPGGLARDGDVERRRRPRPRLGRARPGRPAPRARSAAPRRSATPTARIAPSSDGPTPPRRRGPGHPGRRTTISVRRPSAIASIRGSPSCSVGELPDRVLVGLPTIADRVEIRSPALGLGEEGIDRRLEGRDGRRPSRPRGPRPRGPSARPTPPPLRRGRGERRGRRTNGIPSGSAAGAARSPVAAHGGVARAASMTTAATPSGGHRGDRQVEPHPGSGSASGGQTGDGQGPPNDPADDGHGPGDQRPAAAPRAAAAAARCPRVMPRTARTPSSARDPCTRRTTAWATPPIPATMAAMQPPRGAWRPARRGSAGCAAGSRRWA